MRSRATRFIGRLRARLAGTGGESLVETLVATLIMALVMLMLCTAIVSAAKINATVKASDARFDQTEGASPVEMTVTVTPKTPEVSGGLLSTGSGINAYENNGYYFYEPAN